MYFVMKEDYKKNNYDSYKALPSELGNVLVQEKQTIRLIFYVLQKLITSMQRSINYEILESR